MAGHAPIAVVGASGLFPGAHDLGGFWNLMVSGTSAATAAPRERWSVSPERFVLGRPCPDRAYSRVSCLLEEPPFDPRALGPGLPDGEALDPTQRIVLRAGQDLFAASVPPQPERERTAVILAAIVLPTDSATQWSWALLAPRIEEAIGRSLPRGRESPAPPDPCAARVASFPAALLARAFGLGGGSFTLDAACASSLYAVKLACDALRAGRADAVVTGGVSRPDALFTQIGFSQLRALSPSGRCAPFDRLADGLVVGEGVGLLLLKRLEDALREGDRIWGVIRGIGLSNDMRGSLLAPDPEGQLRALAAAYAQAGWRPEEVDYIECHGAGTPVGDAAELESLSRLRGTGPPCPIGSVKSIIGHLLTAAGAAGMIRVMLAMRHGLIPPTLNFREPPPGSPIARGRFRLPGKPEPWPRRGEGIPRRAGVSAFGFGGINAHLLLEEWLDETPRRPRSLPAGPSAGTAPPPAGPPRSSNAPTASVPVAVVGWAARLGPCGSVESIARALEDGGPPLSPPPRERLEKSWPWAAPAAFPPGLYLAGEGAVNRRFRIPPAEQRDLLLQHALMLEVAAAAMDDAGLDSRTERPAMGALVGVDFDFEATRYGLRWRLEDLLSSASREGPPFSLENVSPPLTASRVLGSLGSMVASRIAREFRLGGPSYAVSAEACSGLRALEIAMRALQSGEMETVLVGAVDLPADPRRLAARPKTAPAPAEGAVALVLKRHDRALADGDRIRFLLRGAGAAGGEEADALGRALAAALAEAGVSSAAVRRAVCSDPARGGHLRRLLPGLTRIESTAARLGDGGAAGGLYALLQACLVPADPRDDGLTLICAGSAEGHCLQVLADFPPEKRPAGASHPATPAEKPPAAASPSSAATAPRLSAAAARSAMKTIASLSRSAASAHRKYLDFSLAVTRGLTGPLSRQGSRPKAPGSPVAPAARVLFDRSACLEFARGSAARVLGPEFAAVDRFPVRVRLPDEPLMLVDRILEIEGRKGSLGPGRIVTEHDVREDAWYLDGGRAPVSIAVEAGQADLFLCAWLGIDLVVQGRRAYRLLDAAVRFHRPLPAPGETVRYAIGIEKFLRQGETHLFFFRFEGTVDGRPLISMRGGCAGFFTAEESRNSGGIVLSPEETAPCPGVAPEGFSWPVPAEPAAFDDAALEALREGDAGGAFGVPFAGIRIPETLRLPGGRLRLIDRIVSFEPHGGRYGLGCIRAEADIDPEAWFLACHFVDDRVMPGTLMYECCNQALRVLLLRRGWFLERPGLRFEPVPGVEAVLTCRGPVTPDTRRVHYEVHLREVGYRPEPFVRADAFLYADGRRIVRFGDMSLQLCGAGAADLEAFWKPRRAVAAPAGKRIRFSRRGLEDFATGRSSAAFGDRYLPYDEGRHLARLPAPPFLFLDRILQAGPRPWVLRPGSWAESEFDIRPGAWYVAAERTGAPPFCVLLETALQTCGFLAAFLGSALKSEKDLYFRNLDGSGMLERPLPAEAGTLRTRCRLTRVSEMPDLLLEQFEFEVHDRRGLLYSGAAGFGFFTREALEGQSGIPGGPPPPAEGAGEGLAELWPDAPPFEPTEASGAPVEGLQLPARALRMIDRLVGWEPGEGRAKAGRLRGVKEVRAGEWFFPAHFHGDPVWPGSLGLEALIQLLKAAAILQMPGKRTTHRFVLPAGRRHRWTYRGQVRPRNRRVMVEADLRELEERPGESVLWGDGHLWVDGLCIYRMEGFGVGVVPQRPADRRLRPCR